MAEKINKNNIPLQSIDWTKVQKTEHKGKTGIANWQAKQFKGLRIRLVEYSKDYFADYWCEKGHKVVLPYI